MRGTGSPSGFILSLTALAAFWAVLIYHLGAQWSIHEQYNYGWAVPFLCAYLAWRRVAQTSQPASSSGIPAAPSSAVGPPFSILYFLLALCALAYAPTRWLHEANPIWRLTSWLWALEVIGITLLLTRYAFGARRLVQVAFATCFFLVAVPWPSSLETFLTQSLKQLDVSATTELLGAFSIPALQHGNVIELSSGMIGVDEACSGFRSLQDALMISLFWGEFYALSALRRALCVLAGIALAFIFNVGRTFLLVAVASAKGIGAVGSWHDPTSTTMLVLCFLCLWGFAVWLNRQKNAVRGSRAAQASLPAGSAHQTPPPIPAAKGPAVVWSHAPVVSTCLLAWCVAVELGTELWYRSHELRPATARQWSLGPEAMGAGFVKAQIPVSVLARFRADDSTEAHWQDDAGNAWQLFYFRWEPAHSVKRRVAAQLAKTHGPATCLPAMGLALKSDLGIITVPLADAKLSLEQFLFTANGQPIHVFYGIYEDPSGPSELANRRQDTRSRIAAALAGSRNYGQRFLEIAVTGPPNPQAARIALDHELEKLLKVEN